MDSLQESGSIQLLVDGLFACSGGVRVCVQYISVVEQKNTVLTLA